MHTCPACGEDTDAGLTERCSHCGFAPGEAQVEAEPKKKGPAVRSVVRWAVILGVVGIAIATTGDGDPGPDASEVEDALVSDASSLGLALTVECPDDTNEAPVGSRFTCVAESASGAVRDVVVVNEEDEFRWSRKPFFELQKVERQAA